MPENVPLSRPSAASRLGEALESDRRPRYPLPVASTFLWYDLETFGRDPRWDRIAQFAAQRTDADLTPVGDPIVLYGRISPDYLPSPEACLVTGLTPKKTAEGLVEAELAGEIHALMATPGTCSVGYNSVRFDDEFVRNLFYRNFYDPYRREYARGNSRWDVLPLVRLAHDLRPDGIEWVYGDDGRPVFRLEALTAANGLSHEHAHDALSDVEATRAIAALVKLRQPKLFEFYLSLRNKTDVRRIVNLQHPRPVLYNAPVFTRPGATTSVVFPITANPRNGNEILAFDLRSEPDLLVDTDEETLRRRVFSPAGELDGEPRVPLVGIQVNKVPAVAPLSTLSRERAAELGLSLPDIERRAQALADRIARDPTVAHRIRAIYEDGGAPAYRDPDLNIYSGGFFGDEDRAVFERIHVTPPEELLRTPPSFADPRGPEMLLRYVARNWPDALSDADRRRWHSQCAGRLLAPEYDRAMDLESYRKRIHNLMARGDVSPRDKRVLRDLLDYAAWLDKNILSQG